MTDKKTIDIYDERASEYASRFEGEASDFLRAFLSHLNASADILDLGCGPGLASQKMAQAGHNVLGIDASQGMIDLATANGINARLGTFQTAKGTGPFDGIWANFSLLHAPAEEIPNHFQMIHEELRADGLFHIGMKTGTGQSRDKLGRLYTYIPEDTLAEMIIRTGFTLISRTPGRSAGLSNEQSDWVVILARKA